MLDLTLGFWNAEKSTILIKNAHIHKSDSMKADLHKITVQNVHVCHERGITVCGNREEKTNCALFYRH